MSVDREYLSRTAKRWVDNEDIFDRIGESWVPFPRDAARLADDYLAVLAELDEARGSVERDLEHQSARRIYWRGRFEEAVEELRRIIDAAATVKDSDDLGGLLHVMGRISLAREALAAWEQQ